MYKLREDEAVRTRFTKVNVIRSSPEKFIVSSQSPEVSLNGTINIISRWIDTPKRLCDNFRNVCVGLKRTKAFVLEPISVVGASEIYSK